MLFYVGQQSHSAVQCETYKAMTASVDQSIQKQNDLVYEAWMRDG